MVAPSLSAGEIAIGLAESRNAALGVVVDLSDLSVERRYAESFTRPVLRATPVEQVGSIRYLIDHDNPQLQAARTVPASPPFVVGVNYFGFVRARSGVEPETLWPGGRGNAITEPMFASLPGVGHAVTFARGRLSGSVHVGWLTAAGTPKTELEVLQQSAHEIAAPAIAAGDAGILVAVALRDERESPWRIVIAGAAPGKLPGIPVPMSSGPGPDRTQPSVTALASGWLVSWVEGSEGNRRVRAQVLNTKLERIHPAFDVSNDSSVEDARGALFRVDTRVLSVYVLKRGSGYELWGSLIEC
jgi:hypothetical protein